MSHRSSVFEQLRFDCRMLTENGHLRQLSFYMYFSMVVLYTFRTKDDDKPGQCEEAGLILRFPHVLLLSVHSLFVFVLTCLWCLFCLQIPRKWSDFSLGEAKHTKCYIRKAEKIYRWIYQIVRVAQADSGFPCSRISQESVSNVSHYTLFLHFSRPRVSR